jgi:acetolactate synthase-1/2/3 large subunit
VLAGNGCVRTRVSRQLNRFIDQTGIYAAMTFMGKGAISDRHPQSLYAAGLGARDHVQGAFEQADLVIAIGYDLVEWHPSRWNTGTAKKVLHLDFEPAEVDTAYRPDVEVVGDLAGALERLCERLSSEPVKDERLFADVRETLHQELELEYAEDEGFPVKPQRILSDLRKEMRDDDVLISDVGAHKMWIARHYPTYTPNSCIISNGFCSMAVALPGAIATKLVRPERNVVGLCGDGGFLMNVQELATAAQYRIAPTILVWEDSEYGLIKWKQEDQFGKHSHIRFQNPDLIALALAFGCHAQLVKAPGDLRPALREAFAVDDRPSVIVVPVDYDENMKLTRRLGELLCR